jgi:hypothetical protein
MKSRDGSCVNISSLIALSLLRHKHYRCACNPVIVFRSRSALVLNLSPRPIILKIIRKVVARRTDVEKKSLGKCKRRYEDMLQYILTLSSVHCCTYVHVKSKVIPVTGLVGLLGCEMLKIPHCLDNRLTVNCEILATCSST